MAPNFLSKFKSSPANTRNSLESRSPSPSVQSMSTSTSITNPNSSIASHRSGTATPDSLNTHPSVTVIPPSPGSDALEFPHTHSDDGAESTHDEQGVSSTDRRTVSFSGGTAQPSREDAVPASAHGRASRPEHVSNDTSTTLKAGLPRALTPSSSTGNLRQFVQQASPPPLPTSNSPQQRRPPLPDIRRQPSNKSMRSQTQPTPVALSHSKAPSAPPPTSANMSGSGEALPDTGGREGDSNGVLGPQPLVESPTALRSDFKPNNAGLASASQTNRNLDASLLRARADSDSVSIASATSASGEKKKKSWRRSSTSSKRKPTGLASAIAASGLAMANPAMSVPHFSPGAMSSNSSVSNNHKSNGATPRRSSNPTSHKASASASSISRPNHRTQDSLELPSRHSRSGRRPSLSFSNHSENSFDSDLGDDSDEDESGSEDELDLQQDIPVTGFAVASNKRNADFHELFPSIPDGDYLIEDYGCALQRDILVQGRIYISENHICFHANIFGWITDLSIPIYEITSLEKKMTAFVIPNAIQITTRQSKYTFASFLSRDTTFDVIYNIWRLARPEDSSVGSGGASGRGSMENARPAMDEVREESETGAVKVMADSTGKLGVKVAAPARRATQCACGREGKHFSETAMDTILPGTPDKIYNLIFASGFIKDFMRIEQKLLDIQISDWAPTEAGSTLLTRNMSYIKPLNGSLGPKQTKCELRDETVYCNFDDYVVTITTTRTPEVPSGGVFSVKTRTCLMWASGVSTRVIVTTQVEWTGRSFIKGIIEKSAIDGQKTYHADLDKAMRMYIQEHRTEFVPAGVDPAAVVPAEVTSPVSEKGMPPPLINAPSDDLARKVREHERNRRGLQWAWDTFEGASQVAKQSTSGALELIRDAWDQSTSTTILIFVIVILVISNLWTLTMVGRREEVGRRKEMKKTEEREKWVQGIVTALWDELAAGKGGPALPPTNTPVSSDWRGEVTEISRTLDAVEDRVRHIRESLNNLD